MILWYLFVSNKNGSFKKHPNINQEKRFRERLRETQILDPLIVIVVVKHC